MCYCDLWLHLHWHLQWIRSLKSFFSSPYLSEPWKNYIPISFSWKVRRACCNSFQVISLFLYSCYPDLAKERVECELFQNQNSLFKTWNALCTWGADSKVHAKHLIHEYPFSKFSRSSDLHLSHFFCGQFSNKGSGNSLAIINHADGWGIKRVPLLLQMWFHTFLHFFRLHQKPRCKVRVLLYIMSVCGIPQRNWAGDQSGLYTGRKSSGPPCRKQQRRASHCCDYNSLSDSLNQNTTFIALGHIKEILASYSLNRPSDSSISTLKNFSLSDRTINCSPLIFACLYSPRVFFFLIIIKMSYFSNP